MIWSYSRGAGLVSLFEYSVDLVHSTPHFCHRFVSPDLRSSVCFNRFEKTIQNKIVVVFLTPCNIRTVIVLQILNPSTSRDDYAFEYQYGYFVPHPKIDSETFLQAQAQSIQTINRWQTVSAENLPQHPVHLARGRAVKLSITSDLRMMGHFC